MVNLSYLDTWDHMLVFKAIPSLYARSYSLIRLEVQKMWSAHSRTVIVVVFSSLPCSVNQGSRAL